MNDGDVPRQRDEKRFVVRAEEKVTAFLELQRAIHEFAVICACAGVRPCSR